MRLILLAGGLATVLLLSALPAAAQMQPEELKIGKPIGLESPGDEGPQGPEESAGDESPEQDAFEERAAEGGRFEAQNEEPVSARTGRGDVLLDLACSSSLAHRQITLFGNGTVRLRERHGLAPNVESSDLGLVEDPDARLPHMSLGELSPPELDLYLERLEREDLSESEESFDGIVAGDWVDVCRLQVILPGKPERNLTFGRYDSLSLATSRVVKLAQELEDRVDLHEGTNRLFPADYEPERGDVLERHDGSLFEVVRFTDDEVGAELEGLSQPVTIIVSRGNIAREFRRLVRREQGEDLREVLAQDSQ